MSYPTQNDVARLAQVSQTAVAAALGGTTKVRISDKTREKILKAAAQLRYMPHRNASVTRSGRTGQVALIVHGTGLQTVSHRCRSLANALRKEGLDVVFFQLDWMNRTLEEAWDEALSARVEGVVLSSSFGSIAPEMYKKLIDSPVPVVSLCGPGISGIPLIAPDFRKAFYDVTRYLLESGRRRLLFMKRYRKPDPISQIEWKRSERVHGFLDAVNEFEVAKQCEVFEVWSRQSLASTVHDLGCQGLADALDRPGAEVPEGLICYNDDFALGALTEAMRRGIEVPGQMAITGCDGERWTGYGATPLTTIAQPEKELGERASECLIAMIGGESPKEEAILIPCELHRRASSQGRVGE